MQTYPQPAGILDLRFHVAPGKQDKLAVVSSTGSLGIFELDPIANELSPLRHLKTSRCDDVGEDIMFLQCQWQPDTEADNVGVTTSTGLSRLLILDQDWTIARHTDMDVTNTLEAWCIAFSPDAAPAAAAGGTHQVVYCGGDDSDLQYTSHQYVLTDDSIMVQSLFPNICLTRQHEAGITAILPLTIKSSSGSRLVVTGSYDDKVRLFTIKDPHESYGAKQVQLLAEKNLGGGVWRLNLIGVIADGDELLIRLLASCMFAGARIIEIRSASERCLWTIDVVGRFEEHESMNYGSDFIIKPDGGEGVNVLTIVSTSFYDKRLCVWHWLSAAP